MPPDFCQCADMMVCQLLLVSVLLGPNLDVHIWALFVCKVNVWKQFRM